MQEIPETLRENVRLLGELLGKTLAKHEGDTTFDKVEQIRSLSKALAAGNAEDYGPLKAVLADLQDDQILPIVRAFNQFLNLANIAEMEYFAGAQAETSNKLPASSRRVCPKSGQRGAFADAWQYAHRPCAHCASHRGYTTHAHSQI